MLIKEKKYGLKDILLIPLKCSPVLGTLIGLQVFLGGIIPTIQIVVTANFIDTAISIVKSKSAIGGIYPSLFAVVALIGYSWIAGALTKFAEVKFELSIREKYRTAITEKRAKLSYKHIENSETWDLITRVSKNPEAEIKSAFMDFINMVANGMKIAGILILLINQVWWAALLILAFSIPLFSLAIKSGKANYEVGREVTKLERKYQYLSEVLTGREAVDERTLFAYSNRLGKNWFEQYETARKITLKIQRKWFIKMKTGSIITSLISILIVVVLLNPVLTGKVSIGMFISLVNSAFGLVQMMSWDLTYSMDQLAKHLEYLKDLTKFAALDETPGAEGKLSENIMKFRSLEFKNVSFKYPNTDKYILENLSLKIEYGKHYAFVGINGAGKTTITKLITGLYDNFDGEILLNGKSITTYAQSELKAFFSVVYQDFAKYYISMKDNVKLGNVNNLDGKSSDDMVQAAVTRLGLSDVAEKLPQGMDTPLGKIRNGGQDVSGGEWQRIAMARAVISPAPLRILDEPTAALDPISESRLYEEFEQISKEKTTIFISHRLGSTKLADEIYVIGDGKVIEKGTHKQLMDINGIYSEMYESQRSWYL